jgi:lipopolysaccharide biosynthesis protein
VLWLFVVTPYKWSLNLFTNPNPVYSHTLLYVTISQSGQENIPFSLTFGTTTHRKAYKMNVRRLRIKKTKAKSVVRINTGSRCYLTYPVLKLHKRALTATDDRVTICQHNQITSGRLGVRVQRNI